MELNLLINHDSMDILSCIDPLVVYERAPEDNLYQKAPDLFSMNNCASVVVVGGGGPFKGVRATLAVERSHNRNLSERLP